MKHAGTKRIETERLIVRPFTIEDAEAMYKNWASDTEVTKDPRNPYSGSVMEKCGMRYEGTKIQSDWNNAGICDVSFYGLVKGQEGNGDRMGEKISQGHVISSETIAYIGILAKLELTGEQEDQAKKDMERMLTYIDKLDELDTTGVEPMSHIFPVNNVFREDEVMNKDGSTRMLKNAPEKKGGNFKVPKTIEQ